MQENFNKQQPKRKFQEEVVSVLADKYLTSTRYINMVISGDEDRADILADYLDYKEKHNLLLKEVKRIAPIITTKKFANACN